jgi:Uma2 family endonuclease
MTERAAGTRSIPDVSGDDALIGETIVARGVTYEDYLSGNYGRHVEWVNGVVIAMSPVSIPHDQLGRFLATLFTVMLESTTGGMVLQDPVVMKTDPALPGRQPDIQVILPDRLHLLQTNQVAGPANLVVEIVSPESGPRDRGVKFIEYEKGGVLEYWIIDPLRREPLFYVRGEDGLFHSRPPVDGVYTSVILPQLKLPVELLWRETLPTTREIVQMVEAMLTTEPR